MNYALEVLKKHQTTLEINLKGIPAIDASARRVQEWKKQLKELKTTIEFLEVREKVKNRE